VRGGRPAAHALSRDARGLRAVRSLQGWRTCRAAEP